MKSDFAAVYMSLLVLVLAAVILLYSNDAKSFEIGEPFTLIDESKTEHVCQVSRDTADNFQLTCLGE